MMMEEEYPPTEVFNTLDFEVHSATGGMPFVGNPLQETRYYFWYVGIDQYKRCIASDSEIRVKGPVYFRHKPKVPRQHDSGLI